MNNNIIITIGRQFGSGGREFGQLLAQTLGIGYYDKELLHEAARHAGMCTEFFERRDERFPRLLSGVFSFNMGVGTVSWYNVGSSAVSDDCIYRATSDVLHMLAERESCVVVGRSSDYILRDNPRCLNLFIHAPMADCVRRIMARNPDVANELQARRLAERTNKLRASYYNFYTDKRWGDASSYDLTLDSSRLTMEQGVALVRQYIAMRWPDAPVL